MLVEKFRELWNNVFIFTYNSVEITFNLKHCGYNFVASKRI